MLNIEVHYASSLDSAWNRAKDIADKFFGNRKYRLEYVEDRLEYVEAEDPNDGGYFAYDVTFQAKECSDGPYIAEALRLVGLVFEEIDLNENVTVTFDGLRVIFEDFAAGIRLSTLTSVEALEDLRDVLVTRLGVGGVDLGDDDPFDI